MIDSPMSFQDAIGFLLEKEQLPAEWDAATWQSQEPDFRRRAFFTSRVESARFVDRLQGLLFDYMAKVRDEVTLPNGEKTTVLRVGDRSDFVKQMREFMIEEGMADFEDFAAVNQKDVKDIRSMARLNLIFDTNIRQAYGYGSWKQGVTPSVMKAFPYARLIRDRGVMEPRPRHAEHLGEVRLKSDISWWAEFQNDPDIGGFGVPWGPFGFNSGVNQEDVSKREAKDLGLPDADPAPVDDPGVNKGLSASTKGMDPEVKKKLLEELRNRPKPRDPEEAGREAAAKVRREMLGRGLADALQRGDSKSVAKYEKALSELPPSKEFTIREDDDRIAVE